MPYAGPTHVKSEKPYEFESACAEFGGGNFSEEQKTQATHVTITHSSFGDPGEDWNQFDLYNGDKLIASNTVNGY